jgi:hypothetical protein
LGADVESKNEATDRNNTANPHPKIQEMSEIEREKFINEISERFLRERAEVYKALAKGIES